MSINNRKRLGITVLLILCAFLLSYRLFMLFPDVFETWNSHTVDRLYVLRSSLDKIRPPYDPTIAHIDINNSSLQRLGSPYVSRTLFRKTVK
ncbi:MAG: hypothetical protein JRJ85_28615, partial [Deltaproteobacteria bacterium]|nr:hypothetical protein [Deltaproteobacteria bacterium]